MASTVESTKSQNITVRWRRSPSTVVAGAASGGGGAEVAVGAMAWPHRAQKRESETNSAPQASQHAGNAIPHWWQKRALAADSQ